MIKRIVRLSFDPDKTDAFEDIFENSKTAIRSFPGCRHLELWRDISTPNVYMTYSLWEQPDHLENYRKSELFQTTWAKTKVLFNDRPQAWSVEVMDSPEEYPIEIGAVAPMLESFLAANNYPQIAVLADENTEKYCLPRIEPVLKDRTWQLLRIEAGEIHKNLDTCAYIWEKMLQHALDRSALLINLGGGVIGDMGGFCAGTFKRGIDFIQIPTTLLAQVDASVGGKLGIDFQGLKNNIGLFQNPKAVLLDPAFFETLPLRELCSGFAEIIKHALIQDRQQWEQLVQIQSLDQLDWAPLVGPSLQIKKAIVEADPFEKGIRKALNFGHTIGHAIESTALKSSSPLLHGEAIALGMIAEAYLSHRILGLSREALQSITFFILRIYQPQALSEAAFEQYIEYMKHDKKNSGKNISFTLLPQIGSVKVHQTAGKDLILESLRYVNAQL